MKNTMVLGTVDTNLSTKDIIVVEFTNTNPLIDTRNIEIVVDGVFNLRYDIATMIICFIDKDNLYVNKNKSVCTPYLTQNKYKNQIIYNALKIANFIFAKVGTFNPAYNLFFLYVRATDTRFQLTRYKVIHSETADLDFLETHNGTLHNDTPIKQEIEKYIKSWISHIPKLMSTFTIQTSFPNVPEVRRAVTDKSLKIPRIIA